MTIAAVVVLVEALGLLVMAVTTVISGMRNGGRVAQVLAQGAYFAVLAGCLVAVGYALLRGRRWGRTPALVVQIITGAVAIYLAFPSGRLAWGLALLAVAIGTGYLLLCAPATQWIKKFGSPLGEDPDH